MVRNYCKYNCQCPKCKSRRQHRRASATRTRENARAARSAHGSIGWAPWGAGSTGAIQPSSASSLGTTADGSFYQPSVSTAVSTAAVHGGEGTPR